MSSEKAWIIWIKLLEVARAKFDGIRTWISQETYYKHTDLLAFSFCPTPKHKPLLERIRLGRPGAIFAHLVHGESVPNTNITEVESEELPGE